MTPIKFSRMAKLSKTAQCPRTFRARLANIPESLQRALTAAQLAALIDGPMQASYAAGYAAGAKDAA